MKEIEEKAESVLKELSDALKEAEIDYRGEVYYINELKNVFRKDGKSACMDKEFVALMKKNAPKVDEQGYIIAEVGTWVK